MADGRLLVVRRSPVLTSRSACFARWTMDQVALSRYVATEREVQSLDHIDWPRLVLTPVMSAAFAVGAHRYAGEHGLGDFYLPALIACAPATMLLAWYIVKMEARTRPGSPAAAPIGIGHVLAAALSSTGIFVVLMLGASGFGAMFLAHLHALRRRRVH